MSIPPSISGLSNGDNIRVAIYHSLRLGTVPLAELTPILAGYLAFPSYTADQIADGNHAENPVHKRAGKAVSDSTNSRLAVASGSGQTDPWRVYEPSLSVTPA